MIIYAVMFTPVFMAMLAACIMAFYEDERRLGALFLLGVMWCISVYWMMYRSVRRLARGESRSPFT